MAFLRIMTEKPAPTAFYNNSTHQQRYVSCQDLMDLIEIIRWYEPDHFSEDDYQNLQNDLLEHDIPVCERELKYVLTELGYITI